jgi:hypothetical protein
MALAPASSLGRPTGLANQRSDGGLTFRFGEPVISVATDWAFWGHVSDSSARVGRSSHSTQNRRKLPYFPQFVRAIDHAMVADQFLGEVGRRMPVNERVRSASRFNATMRAAILILAD